ncbi:hypothetical protein MSKU9_0006 [Komagataeibacter diospyri]|uniref:Uncharacterized protein n=1 Tax=Komagataeibacter diospyri TaxID=1932662 RepID=A0A4P5NQS9_9PROT|nr:hypothetical protein MSKU9_0006 [Komagataeibacter diospyri]
MVKHDHMTATLFLPGLRSCIIPDRQHASWMRAAYHQDPERVRDSFKRYQGNFLMKLFSKKTSGGNPFFKKRVQKKPCYFLSIRCFEEIPDRSVSPTGVA